MVLVYLQVQIVLQMFYYIYFFQLLRHGVGLSTGSDSELITQLLTHMPECGEPDGVNWVGRSVFMSPPTLVRRYIVFVLSVTQFVSANPLKLLNRIS